MKFVKLITILALIQSTAQAATVKQLLNDQNLVLVELKKNAVKLIGIEDSFAPKISLNSLNFCSYFG